ncbi:MAG: hypothetical protein ACYT04_49975 [Nostoc sp.]
MHNTSYKFSLQSQGTAIAENRRFPVKQKNTRLLGGDIGFLGYACSTSASCWVRRFFSS